MATLPEVEDAIRKAHAKGNKDLVRRLGEARKQLLAGGEAPAEGGGILDSMAAAGKNIREAVMNPGQSIPDALRTTSNFMTLGLRDRLGAALTDRTYEQEQAETAAADERLGTIDEALNLGGAFVQPSAAGKYMAQQGPGLVNAGKGALAYGAEGAGLSGAQTAIEGGDATDIGESMAFGGGGGAGGSVLGDIMGAFKGWMGKGKPTTDEAFLVEADKAKRNTREGKDLARRGERLEAARSAQIEGRGGFQRILEGLDKTGRKQAGISRAEREALVTLAHKPNKLRTAVSGAGDVASGGTGWGGNLGMGLLTKGIGPAVGAAAKTGAALMDDVSPAAIDAYKNIIKRSQSGQPIDPAAVAQARDALARLGISGGRQQ